MKKAFLVMLFIAIAIVGSVSAQEPAVMTPVATAPPVVMTPVATAPPVVMTPVATAPPVVMTPVATAPPVVMTPVATAPPVVMTSRAASPDAPVVANPIGGQEGYYDVTSSPSGAAVTADGTSSGTTPTTVIVMVTGTPGHTINVNKAGYQPWSQYYAGNPAAGQHIAVHAALVAIPTPVPTPAPGSQKGYYQVSSDPTGGSVLFDGTNYGLTPVTITVSTTGTPGHTITVSKSGYETWSNYFAGNPAADQTIPVLATLSPVAQTGNVYVTSNPSGASAVLDGGYDQLTTPGTFSGVSPGWHDVTVSMSGYQPYSSSIEVKSGQTSNVYATLVSNQQTGSISISSTPVGADIYVDTIFQGETNQIVGDLAAGPHTVTLIKSGYNDYIQSITVNTGQTVSMSAALTPLSNPTSGDLDVYSSPSGASVYLNDVYRGETRASGPLYITGLSPGTYKTVIKKSGYQEYITTANILAGTTAQVSAVLQPASATPTTASADIFSDPSGADVYINNSYKGVTPLSFDNVPLVDAKSFAVEIRMEGYQPYTASGSISPGQNVVINAALAPLVQPTTTKSPLSVLPVIAALSLIGLLSIVLMRKR
ncbi:MAG: PEGA domain-containing protein [Methanoregula sp.]